MTGFSFLTELFLLTQVKSGDIIVVNSFIYASSNEVLETELFYLKNIYFIVIDGKQHLMKVTSFTVVRM